MLLLVEAVHAAPASAQPCRACAGDVDSNGAVTVDELVRGVRNSLEGCPPPDADAGWVTTWSASPVTAGPDLTNVTLRLVIHTSVGGEEVRVELSNVYGAETLHIGAAHVALRAAGAAIVADSDRSLTFAGAAAATVPPGAIVVSDPIALAIPAQSDVAVSLFLPAAAGGATMHPVASQTSYVSLPGDFTASADATPFVTPTGAWLFLTRVDVRASGRSAIAALGDSLTDGFGSSSDTNTRWPDELGRRLHDSGRALAIANAGISGNRLLHDAGSPSIFGQNALARFERDALLHSGLSHVIVLEGINDIGLPGHGFPAAEAVTADAVIGALAQLVSRAHARGVRVFGGTLLPFEGAGYYSAEAEAKRQAVNAWIRSSGVFDAAIDFDSALRDPDHPTRLRLEYDSGDHLHLNDAGYRAMAAAVDLTVFDEYRCGSRAP